MWQRIQTLYLIVAILLQWTCLFVPVGTYNQEIPKLAGQYVYLYNDISNIEVIVISALISICALVAIFKFKCRKTQMKICTLLIFATFASMCLAIVEGWLFIQSQAAMPHICYFSLLLPLLTILMVVLAKRAIRKDDELVRSSNRLR